MNQAKIVNEQTVVDLAYMHVTEGTIQMPHEHDAVTYTRLKLDRVDAAVVLIRNTERNTVVLVKQFRYAAAAKTSGLFVELVAGKLDGDEAPVTAAIRESQEECGYRIQPENIRHLASFFVSPGYTSERFHLFDATVTNADKLNAGGGLESENEFIEVVEIDRDRFLQMAESNAIVDGKTLMGALYMKLLNL